MYQNNIEIILTGSSGFLGSQILQKVINYKFNIFKIRSENSIDNIKSFLINNPNREFIFLNAGWQDVKEYNPSKQSIEESFRIQTKLLELINFNNIKKFINFGSYNEYGLLKGILSEDILNLKPISDYAKLKYKIYGLSFLQYQFHKYIHLRICNIYGESQNEYTLYGTLLSYKKNRKKLIFNNNRILRDMMHVNDFIESLKIILISDIHGVINIGSGRAITNIDFIKNICLEFEIPNSDIEFIDKEVDHYYMSNDFNLCIKKFNDLKKEYVNIQLSSLNNN
jgi:nucleoside-diphosphate-sugar epimerase